MDVINPADIVASTLGTPTVLTSGYGPESIVSSDRGIVRTGQTHGLVVGEPAYITGHNNGEINGDQIVTGAGGTVVSAAANTPTTFKTNLTNPTTSAYNDLRLQFTSGPDTGDNARVTGWNPATQFITLSAGQGPSAPPAGTTFDLLPDSTVFQLSGTFTGVGTTSGTVYHSEVQALDQSLVDITGVPGVTNGRYVAVRLDSRKFSPYTIAGEPVSGTGGGVQGSYVTIFWEAMGSSPGSGRVDTYVDAQEGARGNFYKEQQGALRRLNMRAANPAPTISDKILMVYDYFLTPEWRSAYLPMGGHMKSFMHIPNSASTGDTTSIEHSGRSIPIDTRTAGSPGRIRSLQPHFLANNDTIAVTDNDAVVPNGNYKVQIIDNYEVSLYDMNGSPFQLLTSVGSPKGKFGHINDSGRIDMVLKTHTAISKWSCGMTPFQEKLEPRGIGATTFNDTAGNGGFSIRHSVWTRHWVYSELDIPGDQFTSWMTYVPGETPDLATMFWPGYIIGRRNIVVTTDANGIATCVCQDHLGNNMPHAYELGVNTVGDNFVTIAGTGIAGLDGRKLITSVSGSATVAYNGGKTGPHIFTVTGAAPSQSGTGTSTMHYTRKTFWAADETRGPVRQIFEAPDQYGDNNRIETIRTFWDSSAGGPMPNDCFVYERNAFTLRNFVPNESDLTIFERPIG